ncbi:MAG TPA: type II secretion system F family protein [Pseudohongiella sp.]|nr:type II secretion system F family protein [Pseudohongiella sp.]
MASFVYKARNTSGALVSGELEATTLDAAASDLMQRGFTPIDIRPGSASSRATAREHKPGANRKTSTQSKSLAERDVLEVFSALLKYKKVSLNELIIFTRQMQSLSKAGLPLDRALHGLQGSVKNPAFKQVLQEIHQGLESGLSLSAAMSKFPKVFSPLFLSMVDVGENTGRLDMAFEQIGKFLQLEKNTRKQIKSATRYPIFVMVTIAIALAVITYFVIPTFAETFARFGAELPLETRILMAVSDFVVNWWQFLIGGSVAAIFGFRSWLRTDNGRLLWDDKKRSFPLVGHLFEQIALARFSRTFSMILSAGVPIVHGMGVVAGTVGNRFIGDKVLAMRDGISRGESLYNTAVSADLFTPLVLQMIAVGEESGTIDQLLAEVADFYDAEVEYELKRLGEAIEPILIMFIAGIVLILALGVFLPIWDLNTAVNR